MGDVVPMVFGEVRTFHSDWYGEHEFPWTTDLYEHQGDNGPYECPGMANNWEDFVKITEELYGSTDKTFNPFEKVDNRDGPTRQTVKDLVTHIRGDDAFFKQFSAMKEATPRIRRILCEVAGYASTYLDPLEMSTASRGEASGATSSTSNRFSQNTKIVRTAQFDNILIDLSGLTLEQVKELNNAAVFELNKKARHSYTSGSGAATLLHPVSLAGLKDMVHGMVSVVSQKLIAPSVSNDVRTRYSQLLGLLNSSVSDTEAMLRCFASPVCSKVFSTSSKTGTSLLSKGQLSHFLRALHAWAHGQSSGTVTGLGKLRIGPFTERYDTSPVNLIHLVSLFHFMFAEVASSAVQKAKDLLVFYNEVVTNKRPPPTKPKPPKKVPRLTSGSKACFNCGEAGHVIAHCPKPRTNAHMTCYKCGKKGHHRRDCPEKTTSA